MAKPRRVRLLTLVLRFLSSRSERPKDDRRRRIPIRGFRVVYVFDISQTEGEELPNLDAVRPKLLDGDAPEGLWEVVVDAAHDAGYEVIREQRGSENGYCDFLNKKLAVRPDVEPAQAVKTLVHELGHALLHSEELPKSSEVAEVEVESVAYIVCHAIGLDTSGYSFAYVARWYDGFTELVKDTAERVVGCAKQILDAFELPGRPRYETMEPWPKPSRSKRSRRDPTPRRALPLLRSMLRRLWGTAYDKQGQRSAGGRGPWLNATRAGRRW